MQNYKKEDILVVIKTLERLSDWQNTEEVRALYRARSYTINEPYKTFLVQSSEWNLWSNSRRRDHLKKFPQHVRVWLIAFQNQKVLVENPPTSNAINHWNQIFSMIEIWKQKQELL